MDWQGWLSRVDKIERAHPAKRITFVQIPGGLPKVGWNVQNNVGKRWQDFGTLENMRMGVFGSFHVQDGPFLVKFNTGETVK